MIDAKTDAAARREALDPTRSFIVQAPAGSGKTELLAQRYLRLLAEVETPEQVLAITFTRKAAGEMRDRVLKALTAAADDAPPAEAHRALTWKLARAVRARDAQGGWRLAAHPARLRIETLDAFAHALTRRMPVTAEFGAAPRLAERAADLYAEAARRTLAALEEGEAWSDAVARLLRHLDNDVAQLENLLIAMLGKRDQWLRPIVAGHGREGLEAGLRREVAYQLGLLCAAVPAACGEEMAAIAAAAATNLAPSEPCSSGLPGATPEDLAGWRGIAATLLTRTGEWRRRLSKNEGFPPDQRDLKARATELLIQLADEAEFCARLAATRRLPPVQYDDAQWAVLEALMTLLRFATAQLQLVFGERGSVDFIEMALRAQRALGEPDAPSDLALALDDRLQHILVDEFQDTSYSQYELLRRLTAGWSDGDGRTLFVVGDPMQSIYRFREAEVGLFLGAREEGLGAIRLEPLQLRVNFRSTPEIVEWINASFATLFPAAEDRAAGAVPYMPAIARAGADGASAVEVIARFESDPADEAARVAELVCARRRAAPDESIAILARSRPQVAAILAALRQAGQRAQAVEIEHLADRPVVRDLMALTRALTHLGDRVAWLAILRAPWCGLTLADLLALAGEDERCVWTLLNDDARLARLSSDGRARAGHVTARCAPALANRQRQDLRQTVESTWLALGGPACVAEPADLDNADAFFALLEELDEAGELADAAALEQRLDKLYARPDRDADDRLQVMTIHKAKGLEFDTVILPGLERMPRSDARQLLLWLERPRGGAMPDFLLAPIAAADADHDALYAGVKAFKDEQDELEQLRLLYVAATRARRRLYLFGNVGVTEKQGERALRAPPARSLLARLWPRLQDHFEAQFANAPPPMTAPAATASTRAIRRLVAGWQLPEPAVVDWHGGEVPDATASLATVEFSWVGETARHVGILVHALLERIAHDGVVVWSPARVAALAPVVAARLRAQGLAGDEVAAACDRVLTAVSTTLEDQRGRWLLEAHPEARSEYALSGMVDGRRINGVIDRTFVHAGTRWIVDYKTSRHEGGDRQAFLQSERERYRSQLETYARLIGGREQRPQRLALYFPLLGEWVEWEHAVTSNRS